MHPSRNQHLNGFFHVPTLEETIQLMLQVNEKRGIPVGIYIEVKCPICHQALGFHPKQELTTLLKKYNLITQAESASVAPVIIQNFDKAFLQDFASSSDLPRVQLLSPKSMPDNLTDISTYAHGIGPHAQTVFPSYSPLTLSPLVQQARDLGLLIHIWGVYDDNLPSDFRHAGEFYSAVRPHVQGVFTEYPDRAHSAYVE